MQNNQKSMMLRGMTRDGSARVLVINSRDMVNDMIKTHKTSPTATAALGRLVTAASMIGSMLPENGDTVTVGFKGSGPLGQMLAVADYYGCVKAYIENPMADLPCKKNGTPDVGNAVGPGTVFMVRDLADGEPQTGTVEIVSGEIAEDLATYFAKSEQVPTLLSLGVTVDKDGSCLAAGGVLIQLLPFPEEETVTLLERNAEELSHISALFEKGMSNEEIAALALRDIPFDPFDTLAVSYRCDCSTNRMKKKMRSLAKSDILAMLDEQEAEGKPRELTAVCRFCGSEYTFSEKELLK